MRLSRISFSSIFDRLKNQQTIRSTTKPSTNELHATIVPRKIQKFFHPAHWKLKEIRSNSDEDYLTTEVSRSVNHFINEYEKTNYNIENSAAAEFIRNSKDLLKERASQYHVLKNKILQDTKSDSQFHIQPYVGVSKDYKWLSENKPVKLYKGKMPNIEELINLLLRLGAIEPTVQDLIEQKRPDLGSIQITCTIKNGTQSSHIVKNILEIFKNLAIPELKIYSTKRRSTPWVIIHIGTLKIHLLQKEQRSLVYNSNDDKSLKDTNEAFSIYEIENQYWRTYRNKPKEVLEAEKMMETSPTIADISLDEFILMMKEENIKNYSSEKTIKNLESENLSTSKNDLEKKFNDSLKNIDGKEKILDDKKTYTQKEKNYLNKEKYVNHDISISENLTDQSKKNYLNKEKYVNHDISISENLTDQSKKNFINNKKYITKSVPLSSEIESVKILNQGINQTSSERKTEFIKSNEIQTEISPLKNSANKSFPLLGYLKRVPEPVVKIMEYGQEIESNNIKSPILQLDDNFISSRKTDFKNSQSYNRSTILTEAERVYYNRKRYIPEIESNEYYYSGF